MLGKLAAFLDALKLLVATKLECTHYLYRPVSAQVCTLFLKASFGVDIGIFNISLSIAFEASVGSETKRLAIIVPSFSRGPVIVNFLSPLFTSFSKNAESFGLNLIMELL